LPPATDRLIGTLLDQRYRILRQVGRGGAGIVYEAEHEAMARRVAVKVLAISLDEDGRAVDRFRREARAAGRLNHPHVVTVHDYGATGGHPFMVMEYCEGGSLADQLRARGTLPLADAVGLLQDVCAAMDAAHAAGIVHRDLKPGNILFAQGVVKVADFGLAHLMEEEDHTLTAGHIIGSPHYMSPEQWQSIPADARTDVYSLGVIAYEALTGTHPFKGGSTRAILAAHLTGSPARPAQLRTDLPEEASRAVLKAIAREPADRFPRAGAFAEALCSALPTEPGSRQVTLVSIGKPGEGERTGPVSGSSHSLASPLGRVAERDALMARLEDAREGRGGLVTIAGAPGMGKSMLVAALLERAHVLVPDLLSGVGRCSEHFGSSEAYQPFLEALGALVQSARSRHAGWSVSRLAPTWASHLQAGPDDRSGGDSEPRGRDRMPRELLETLSSLAEEATVIVALEDVHWADPFSVDLLHYLASRLEGRCVLVVATYRPEDVEIARHPLRQALRHLQRVPAWTEVTPTLFAVSDVRAYLSLELGHAPPEELVEFVHRRTEGNPLFVANVMNHLLQTGALVRHPDRLALGRSLESIEENVPEGLMGVLQDRIDRLEEGDRRLLQAGSVEGDAFAARVVAVLTGEDELAVEERLDRIQRVHRLIVPLAEVEYPDGQASSRFRFVHTLYQNALYASVTSKRRALWHRQAAQELQRLHEGHLDAVAVPLAVHFEKARLFAEALSFRLRAAQYATRGSPRQARPHLQRALELAGRLPDDKRDEARADLLVRLARLDAETAEIVGDTTLYERAEDAVTEALALRPEDAAARTVLALIELERGRNENAFHDLLRVLATSPAHAPAYDGLAYLCKNTGFWEEALALQRRAGELDPSYAHSIRQLSVLIYQDRFDEARAEADALLLRRPGYSHYLYWRGIVEMYAGDPESAGEWIRKGFDRDPEDQIAQGVLAEWEARHGDPQRARELLATAEPGALADGTFTYWIAKIYAALHEPAAAVEWLGRAEGLGYWNAPWLAKDPTLQVLHGDPAFVSRLASVRRRHEAFGALLRSHPEAVKLFDSP
jgi:serine/threonine protein kinase/tetratricopeptide (TPR) repeat protein